MKQAIRCGSWARTIVLVLLMTSSAGVALAQEQGCIELKTIAQLEQEYVDDQGLKARRLVPAGKVLPGDEVIWTVTARNVCSERAEDIVIGNAVPEHMTYVASSAIGVGAEITYSLNGKEFLAPAALTVRESDGATRAARADEYRAIRWAYRTPFEPGAIAFVRYRALVR